MPFNLTLNQFFSDHAAPPAAVSEADALLWKAIMKRSMDSLRHTLANGANPNAIYKNDNGVYSALSGAVSLSKPDEAIIRALMEAGAHGQGKTGVNAWVGCLMEGRPTLLEKMLEWGQIDAQSQALCIQAAYFSANCDLVERLLETRPPTEGTLAPYLEVLSNYRARYSVFMAKHVLS